MEKLFFGNLRFGCKLRKNSINYLVRVTVSRFNEVATESQKTFGDRCTQILFLREHLGTFLNSAIAGPKPGCERRGVTMHRRSNIIIVVNSMFYYGPWMKNTGCYDRLI